MPKLYHILEDHESIDLAVLPGNQLAEALGGLQKTAMNELLRRNPLAESELYSLSKRAQNVLTRNGLYTFQAVMRWHDRDYQGLPQCGRKSAAELRQMLEAVQLYTNNAAVNE